MAEAQTPPNAAHAAFLSDLAQTCREASNLLAEAGKLAKEMIELGYADAMTGADFAGTLAGLTPEHAAKVAEFIVALDALANTKGQSGTGLTFRQAILALARAAR